MVRQVNGALTDIFYETKNPAVYGTARKIKKDLLFRDRKRVTNKKIKNWLEHQDVDTLHKQAAYKFKRNHYTVFGIDHLWEIDLCDMQAFAKYNAGYKFILSVIDVFSKFGWMVVLKNKTAKEVLKAFRKIITESGRTPLAIQSDKGSEFKNKIFKGFLSSKGIKLNFPVTQSLNKASVIERWNRTIKTMMFKYFTYKGKGHRRYVNVLDDLVSSYNNSKHSTIKMAPANVTAKDTVKIFNNIKKTHKDPKNVKAKLKKNDFVRIVRVKSMMEHGYTERWTRELFKIRKVIYKKPYAMYQLVDLKDKDILGKFYAQQLQRVQLFPNVIIKVIKTRGLGKSLQFYVEIANNKKAWVDKKEYESRKV